MSPTQVMPQEWVSLGGETREEGVSKGASWTGHPVGLWAPRALGRPAGPRRRRLSCYLRDREGGFVPVQGCCGDYQLLPLRDAGTSGPPAGAVGVCPRSPGQPRGRVVRLRRRPCLGCSDWSGRGSLRPTTSVGSAPFPSGHQDSPGWECVSSPPFPQ